MAVWFIIYIIVVNAIMFAVVIWSMTELFRLHKQIKNMPHDIKIMNKTNVDDFIRSKQWHNHLKTCPGKKHSKCVTINSDETV